MSSTVYSQFAAAFKEKAADKGIQMKPLDGNLVDKVWTEDSKVSMPTVSKDPVFIHDVKYAGKSVVDKLTDLAKVYGKGKICTTTKRVAGPRQGHANR